MVNRDLSQTIVVVDDEPHILTAIKDILEPEFIVFTNTSAADAMDFIANHRDVCAIISDQRMPGMSGHQFLQAMRKVTDATRILITGYADITAVTSAINGGQIFGYISKPWQPEKLRQLVHQACNHCEALRALEEERRLLRNLMEHVPDAIYFKDCDLRFLRANHSYAQTLGRADPQDLTARTLADFLPSEQAGFLDADDAGVITSGLVAADILRRTHGQDGEIRWLSETRAPMIGSDGSVVGMVGVVRDITKRKRVEEELRESQESARAVVQSALDAFVLTDVNGLIIDWNSQAEISFGWPRDQVIGKLFADTLLALPYRAEYARILSIFHAHSADQAAKLPSAGERMEWSAIDRLGRDFPIELTINPVAINGGLALSVFIRDITDRKEQENRILRLARVYAMLSAVNAVIIRVRTRLQLFEDTMRIVRDAGQFGAAWVGAIGSDAEVVRPIASSGIDLARLADYYHPDGAAYSQGFKVALETLRTMEPLIINDLSAVPAGHISADYQSMVVLPLRIDAAHLGVLVLYARERDFFDDQEITILRELAGNISFALDHIEKEETLDYLALYDGLTGLPNRTLFADRLTQQIQVSKRDGLKLALLVLNLERFRNVNETLGLSGGDALLKLVAERLREIGLGEDNLSRTNGDCFVLSLYDVKAECDVARVLQEQILPCFQRPFALTHGELLVSASVGIALYPDDGDTTDILFSNAEIMQKKARQSGERFLFYAPGMNTRVARELHLETRLRKAIAANEYVLYYQPKVNLRNGQITGLEALIRWNDPVNGLIPPSEFIPALEETGMIIEVGKWALEQATIDYGVWLAQGLQPPRIAVNVSPIQLRHSDFVASIGRIVETCPHAVDCLDLELTESLLMEDIQSSISKLKKIKEYNIQIGIDDFGTGYSSLAYLAKLPVDALKIDRTFITNMSDNPDNLMIVTTIISLGHNLGLKVIAEGVETEEQAKFLRLLRCDEMQGFLISRPVPPLAIQAMLKNSG